MIHYGDFAEDDTVDMIFNTFDSNDPSASVTIGAFLNTDVHIHKDLGLTQRNNAAGITVSVDFDGITGNHAVKIDTSDNTVAGFYVTGSEYQVRIEGTTVDGATINAWIGSFSIERAGGALALCKLIQTAVITNAQGADVATDVAAAIGTDSKCLISTDVQDLSATLDVNTKTITAGIIANATFAADVGSTAYATNIIALAVRKVLDEINLDHLMKVATSNRATLPEVVDDTILANLMTKTDGDTSDFDITTDSLEAIADSGGGDATEAKQDSIIAAVITNAAGVDVAADIIGVKAVVDGLNDVSSADVEAAVDAALDNEMPGAPTADSLNERIMGLKFNLINKMVVTELNGNTVTYKDDDGTEYANVLAAFASAAGVTTRKRLE